MSDIVKFNTEIEQYIKSLEEPALAVCTVEELCREVIGSWYSCFRADIRFTIGNSVIQVGKVTVADVKQALLRVLDKSEMMSSPLTEKTRYVIPIKYVELVRKELLRKMHDDWK